MLRLATTLHDFVWATSEVLPGGPPDDPAARDGDRLVLTLTADNRQTLSAEKVRPGTPLLELHARPGALKKALVRRAGIAGGLIRAYVFSTFVLGYRAEPRYVAQAMKGITDFPFQLAEIDLVVARRGDGIAGLAIDADLVPRKDTWLAEVLAGVEPSPRGAHLLRTPDAALSIAAAVQGPALPRLLAPFGECLASLRGSSIAERAEFRRLATQRLPLFDGSFSMLIDGPGRYVRLVGIQAPARYAESVGSELGMRFDCRRVGRPDIEIAAARPQTLEGTPLRVMLKESDVAEAITEPNAEALSTFAGIVGDFSVKARLPSEGKDAARLLARIQARHLRRLPLLDKALVLGEVHLPATRLRNRERTREVIAAVGPLLGGPDRAEQLLAAIPQHIEIAVAKVLRDARPALHLRIRTR